ncbi:DUF1707 domain-containing protein [Actinopolymorpha pittospori]|uniref:DUF1707 domain-containing protein n=1 Tax=Actinopolymorpha pittospori TaxID=648752 RepID=A0A927MRY0_9ACTN|nr:hypothetical protein [Actinopolymorpha pittospori]
MSIEHTPVRRPPLIGDEERQSCAELLAAHHAPGRLDPEEFEERLGLALTARTAGDLGRLLADLPISEAAPSGPRRSVSSYLMHPLIWVSSGVLLLLFSWLLIFLWVDSVGEDAGALALVTSVAGVISTLLVVRGIRGRLSGPSRGREDHH